MTPKSPVNAVAVKKEEKEARLREFVTVHLADTAAAQAAAGCASALVVARSPQSPVVVALEALRAELEARGVAVFAVLACDATDSTIVEAVARTGWTVRTLADARFREAHEQLVLGPACAWIGDSMRREPLKRDAFESYAASCAATAEAARKSFQRLWQAARPPAPAAAVPASEIVSAVATLSDPRADAADGPLALTRQ